MKTDQVRPMHPKERFFYWVEERHQVYLKRKARKPKPWSEDFILQNYFFTNPYREHDKTTEWFRQQIRNPLKNSSSVLFATCCFRWFNLIKTGEVLIKYNLLEEWNKSKAIRVLSKVRGLNQPIFTGAFMINSPPGVPKLEAICERVNTIWLDRKHLIADATFWKTMEEAHKRIMQYPGLAGFMAYEVVCDLRYTKWLEKATDKMTWCNPGPGCARGLRRLADMPIGKGNAAMVKKPDNWMETMVALLQEANKKLSTMPPFEMREIEHSLCEWDKYERMLWGNQGKSKRRFQGEK